MIITELEARTKSVMSVTGAPTLGPVLSSRTALNSVVPISNVFEEVNLIFPSKE